MLQKILTLLIVALAFGYVLWRLLPELRAFRSRAGAPTADHCQRCNKHHHGIVQSGALIVSGILAIATFGSEALAQHRVVDDTGASVELKLPARRIVSLAPGSTELLFAAGAGSQIVATVQGADEPVAAKEIERIGDANALKYNRLKALKPDVIVVWQGLANPTVLQSLRKLEIPLYFVSVSRFEDIPESVRRLGALAGTVAAADASAKTLRSRVAMLPKAPAKPRLDVFYMIWDSPLYTVGNQSLMSDAIRRCGGRNIFDDLDMPAPIVEFGVILGRNPDAIIMAAPPITSRDWRERWQGFPEVKAVASKRLVSFTDTRLTRMGPTAIDAVADLCELIQKLPD